jgi:hypothetical protein
MGLFDFLKPQSEQQKRQSQLTRAMKEAMPAIYPRGTTDFKEWSRRVYDAVGGKLTLEECQFIFGAIVALFKLAEDKSENRIVDSILKRANGKISREDAVRIYRVVCAYYQAG